MASVTASLTCRATVANSLAILASACVSKVQLANQPGSNSRIGSSQNRWTGRRCVLEFKKRTFTMKTGLSRGAMRCSIEENETREGWAQFATGAAVSTIAALVVAFTAAHVPATQALEGPVAADLFKSTCAACHNGGGNILQPGAGLTIADMNRNGIMNAEDVYNITYLGKGRMPGYGANCAPRGQCTFGPRLSDETIHLLADFVIENAQQGWTNSF